MVAARTIHLAIGLMVITNEQLEVGT